MNVLNLLGLLAHAIKKPEVNVFVTKFHKKVLICTLNRYGTYYILIGHVLCIYKYNNLVSISYKVIDFD